MKPEPKKNQPASVRQRLLTLSERRTEPFDLVFVRYGIERLLYRLSRSRSADKFLLKGAMIFAIWSDSTHRLTRDVDLLGFGSPQIGAPPNTGVRAIGNSHRATNHRPADFPGGNVRD